jgi:Family of unknown function (DUF5994)
VKAEDGADVMAPHDRTHALSPHIPQVPRLSLDPALGRLGVLGGGWWPRSRDASIELPSLISSLNARVGAVLRLGVDARDWDDIPRRITVGGHRVRVGWFADLDHKIIVTRNPQDHIFLLVVPPHASTIAAKSALAMASIGKHSSTPEEILIASGIQHDGKANPLRATPDDDHHPRERTSRTAAFDAAPLVSEDAPRDKTGQIDRRLDDGAPPLTPRHSTGTDPPTEQAQPPPEQGCPQPADRSAPERGAAMSSTTKFETTSSRPPTPRLLLQPARAPGALFDGGWWPRSADPVAELPSLIMALQGPGPPGDHGPVAHVLLHASDWDSWPRRLRIEGTEALTDTRIVRLSWFEALPGGRIIAIYADGHGLDLLTVPPHTDRNTAWAAIEQAIRIPEIPASVTTVTTPSLPRPDIRNETAREIRWQSEGGQSQARAAGV